MSRFYNGDLTTTLFQIRISTYNLLVLKIFDPMEADFFVQLRQKIERLPSLFNEAPVILDLSSLSGSISNFILSDFLNHLHQLGVVAIGIQGGDPHYHESARSIGLISMPKSYPHKYALEAAESEPSESVKPPTVVMKPVLIPNMILADPIRSGKQIHASNSNMVVIATVSPGAEVLADGDIHIYGALRGRAIAGVSGNTDARIFCQSMEAEMIAIAGHYRSHEDIDPAFYGKAVHIYLHKNYLYMDTLLQSSS